jgi:hypothetical protein
MFVSYDLRGGPPCWVPLAAWQPVAEHGEKKGSHGPYYARFGAWNWALAHEQAAPVK